MFRLLQEALQGWHLLTNKEVKQSALWLQKQIKQFYAENICKLMMQWKNCTKVIISQKNAVVIH